MLDQSQRLTAALADRYRIARELGRGGMATVFLAEDLKHHRRVAIKVLDPEVAAAVGPERFLREIETVAQLTHPHILPLHDSGVAAGLLFYVMPYVEGESLRQRLAREKQLPVDDALRIAREVADALSYAHSCGVVHRDVKPENILLESGHAVVADFGIARAVATAGSVKLTATGVAVGTPAYLSPEQAAGSQVLDGRSDLYSLGCVLYEMLAGQPPFVGPTAESLAHQHLSVTPRPVTELRPAVPAGVAAALQRALAKAPADRFNPVALFGEALGHRDTAPARAHGRGDIAVLPFQNVSAGGPHDYFASGLHDELITQLAKVAALKVISRTSVMGYATATKPLGQIAAELGVGSIVEGSVQVAGNRLRVNVQLIDAATDGHLWAERYDRTLDDAFAIQSDVAQQVVAAVGATLGAEERRAIAAAPTSSPEAYRFFLQGEEYRLRPGYLREDFELALKSYEWALALDPDFALAHAGLSQIHGQMYWHRYDPAPARAARQRDEAEKALGLAPESPQVRVAMGLAHYWGSRDYRGALREFQIALRSVPRDAELWFYIGVAERRLGNWSAAREAYEKATQLNPRGTDLFSDLGAMTFSFLRRYPEAARIYDYVLTLAPDLRGEGLIDMAWMQVTWRGNLGPLQSVLDRLSPETELGGWGPARAVRASLLLMQRRADALLALVRSTPEAVFQAQRLYVPTALYSAWANELRGDAAAARADFESSCALLDPTIAGLADDWRVHSARGLALAGAGRRDEALREVQWLQGCDVYRADAFGGPRVAEKCAMILARTCETAAALDEVERLLAGPAELSIHMLRLDPRWDPVREHPRFKELLVKYADPEKWAVR